MMSFPQHTFFDFELSMLRITQSLAVGAFTFTDHREASRGYCSCDIAIIQDGSESVMRELNQPCL